MAAKRPAPKSRNVTLTADMRLVVLHGPEPMLRRLRLNQLRDALAEKCGGDMEPIVIDGETAQLADVFDEVREYSLLQSHKLVVVDQAETFVTAHRRALERYAENPVDHATLVLRCDTWRPGNLDKMIARVGAVVRCDQPSAAEARNWAVNRCRKEHGRTLERAAAATLVERIGPHLMQLDTELARLALMVGPNQPITGDLVERAVRRSSDEQAWAVQEAMLAALADGRPGPLIAKIHELIELSGQSDVQVSYFITDVLRKLHVARQMLAEGAGRDEVSRELKLWGPRQALYFAALRNLEPSRVRRLFTAALEAAARPRRSLGDPVRSLEAFCIQLTQPHP